MIRLEPKPVDIEDSHHSTSYMNESGPFRCPNTYPKVLNLGRGRGKGKASLANWTSVVKGWRHGIIIDQTPWEPERNLAIVAPTDKIVHMDSVQIYKEDPAPTRPRVPLANWTSVHLGNNPKRPTVNKITKHWLKWHIFANDNTDYRPGQGWRYHDHDNRPSDELESIQGDPHGPNITWQ